MTLSPVMVAPVCHVGDPLQLICTASVEFIRWSILHINPVQINSRDENQMRIFNDLVDSVTFTFLRSSAQFASPLISTLSIDSVSIGLNGTVVHCTDIANSTTSASTTIHILDANTTLSKL